MSTIPPIKRGTIVYLLSLYVATLAVGYSVHIGISTLQEYLFQAKGEILLYGYLTSLFPVCVGLNILSWGLVWGVGMTNGRIKENWRGMVLLGAALSVTLILSAPPALLRFIKFRAHDIVLSDTVKWLGRQETSYAYEDVMYVVYGVNHVHFRDGTVFRGLTDFPVFANEYRERTGKNIKIYYETTEGIQAVPDSAEN